MIVKKTDALKIVNPLIGVLFIIQASSGIFHEQIPYEVFEVVHGKMGWLFTLTIIVHIYLNWTWIVTNFFKKKSVITKPSNSSSINKK